jgi:hypothetical protein
MIEWLIYQNIAAVSSVFGDGEKQQARVGFGTGLASYADCRNYPLVIRVAIPAIMPPSAILER